VHCFFILEVSIVAKPKIQVQVVFDLVLRSAQQVAGFDATPAELAVLRRAFDGLFNVAQTAPRKTAQSWCGYVRRDGTIDEKALLQCLQSAFARLFFYHLGTSGAYLGTIINATDNLRSLAEPFGLVPHPGAPKSWRFEIGSPEYLAAKPLNEANEVAARHFADTCDTFAQVFVFINKRGQTSSVPGDEWRRALGVA
jgi:hypothetical protein